jgi:hypothetical protein
MKLDWSFLRLVAISFLGVGLLAYYPLAVYASAETLRSVVGGGVVGLFHVLMGYGAIELGFEQSHTRFLKIVVGGMTLRLFLLVGTYIVMIRYFGYESLSLTLTLLFFYVLNLVLEIYHLQRRVRMKHPTLQA